MTLVKRTLAVGDWCDAARVNLVERSVLVMGSPDLHALLAAVQQASYGAEMIQDEEERCRR